MKKFIYKKSILIVTGGTGGHIFPALSVYNELIRKKFNVMIITDIRGLNYSQVARLKPDLIHVKGYEGKNIANKIISLFLIFLSCLKSFLILRKNKINLVIGFGSYVQVPVLIAAKILKIEIILHEANAVIGKANKIFWNLVKYRTSTYKLNYKKIKPIVLGTPVRKEIVDLHRLPYIIPSKEKPFNILILGGSLGSSALSYNISKCLSNLPNKLRKKIRVTHQVTKEQKKKVIIEYKLANITANVLEFIENIPYHLKLSHLVICRAGASTIAENLIAKLPAIYIPLPSAIGNHQFLNAKYYKERKAAWIFCEEKILKNEFLNAIKKIVTTKDLLKSYSNNAKDNAEPKASKKFCSLVVGVLNAKL